MDIKTFDIKRKDQVVLHTYVLQQGDKKEDVLRLALEDACQKKISLKGADLSHTKIKGAVINGLDLSFADLSGAEIIECQANKLNLSSINGKGLLISRSELNGADFSHSNLSHATLHCSHLKKAEVGGASFNGALFNTVDLHAARTHAHASVNFDGAMLFKCNLNSIEFDNPYFRFSRLIKSNLDNTTLTLPKFHKSLIDDCSVKGLHLDGANGSYIKIKWTNIKDISIGGIDNLQKLEVDGFVYNDNKNLSKIIRDNWVSIPRFDYTDAQKSMMSALHDKNQASIDRLCTKVPRPGKQFDLMGMDLSNMDLSGLSLKGINFTGSNFTGSTLIGTDFSNSTLDGAIFNSATQKHLDCSDIKLNKTSMRNTRFTHLNMEYANVKDAVMCFVYMKDVAMVKSEMSGIKMLCSLLDKQSLFNGSQLIGATLKSMELRGGSFANASLKESEIIAVHSSYTRFAKADFTRGLIKKSDFKSVDLSSSDFSGSTLNEVVINHSKLQRVQAIGATLNSVLIENTALQGSNFTRAAMKLGGIKNCNVGGSNWENSMVDSVSITNTNVGDARNTSVAMLTCAGIKQEKAVETHTPAPMPNELKTILQGLRSKPDDFSCYSF